MLGGLRIALTLLALGAGLAPRSHQLGPGGHGLERLRERWHARSADERARLERHLDEFERLERPARHRLLERARALREREQALEASMSEELRAKVARLGPELRRAELRERFRARGRELRSALSPALQARLESSSPEQRRRMLEKVFEERERASGRVLDRLREHLGLPAHELQSLERLPPPQRLRALRELGRKIDELRGPPRGR